MNQLIWSAGSPLYENSADFENGLKHESNRMAPHRNKSSSIVLIHLMLSAVPKANIECI
jgi:hypothetical protein